MQTYPNYSMNGYSPYQMPMYQQQYPQHMAQQQYMDRMAQLQSMQQGLQLQPVPNTIPGLTGRVVDDFSVITANDVPMDGNGAIFVKSDGSEIQVRNWTAQGTIATSQFKPVVGTQADNVVPGAEKRPDEHFQEFTMAFMQRFDGLEQRFDKLEKSLVKKTKREATEDE